MEKTVFESLLEFYLSADKSVSVDRFCHELNDDNLRCYTFVVISKNKLNKNTELKLVNCVYIKDDKYSINGAYLIDQDEDNNTIAHFLMPIQDLNKYVNNIIELDPVNPNCCYYALSIDAPNDKKLYNSYARVLLKQQKLLDEKEEREKLEKQILELQAQLKQQQEDEEYQQWLYEREQRRKKQMEDDGPEM